MKTLTSITFIVLLFTTICSGTIRNVPTSYPLIHLALYACQNGDTVRVQPGTYYENITWPSVLNIKLVSVGGSANTVISGGAMDRVLFINTAGLDTNTVIQGFTLQDGVLAVGSGLGGGALITNTSVLFNDVVITGNRVYIPGGHGYGGGLHLSNSSSVFRNCVISYNFVDSATWCFGGGVYISGGSPTFSNVTISNNTLATASYCYGVGLYAADSAVLNLNRVTITNNNSGNNAMEFKGNGVYLENVIANMENVLIANNVSGSGGTTNFGGGIYCSGAINNVNMMNCTVSNNTKTGVGLISGSGIFADNGSQATITNSIMYNINNGPETGVNLGALITASWSLMRGGWAGLGILDVVPGFVSATDYHLMVASPCAGTGTDVGAPAIDRDGNSRPLPLLTMPDLGCYEVDQSTISLYEISEANTISVYPNPVISGNKFTIQNATDDFVITDVTGRVVFKNPGKNEPIEITTWGWESGMYFLYSPGVKGVKFQVTSDK